MQLLALCCKQLVKPQQMFCCQFDSRVGDYVQLLTKRQRHGADWTSKVVRYLKNNENLEGRPAKNKYGLKSVIVDIGAPFWEQQVNQPKVS